MWLGLGIAAGVLTFIGGIGFIVSSLDAIKRGAVEDAKWRQTMSAGETGVPLRLISNTGPTRVGIAYHLDEKSEQAVIDLAVFSWNMAPKYSPEQADAELVLSIFAPDVLRRLG